MTKTQRRLDGVVRRIEAGLAIKFLRSFIGSAQISVVLAGIRGEERDYFINKMIELEELIRVMPHTKQTDSQGDAAIAYLHYFKNGTDFYITEKDMGCATDEIQGQQHQAFGLADLGFGFPELGYISIQELIEAGVELDFHWTPKTIRECKVLK